MAETISHEIVLNIIYTETIMKRQLAFKQKVLSCQPICGTHIALDNPAIGTIFGTAGFDFVWIDTEHTDTCATSLMNVIAAVQAENTPAIVRVPVNDLTATKHTLEMGPDGIVFPTVNTPEEADQVMKMCMYPPEGTRGFGPLRAVKYGARDMDEYIAASNNELTRFIQIESRTAVENLPEIIKNPYIDGYIFGPCDLSGSIGELNKVFGDNTQKLIKQAIAILKDAGKCIGVSTGSIDPEVIAFWNDLGINMISSGADFDYMRIGCRENLKNIRKIQGRD